MSDADTPVPATPVPATAGAGKWPSPHFGWALVVSMLFFLPLGAVAIYQGFRTVAAIKSENFTLARKRSRSARRWIIATILVGLLIDGLVAAVFLLLGAFPP